MTILHVDIMWALVLLGITLWTTGCVLMNPGLRGMRWVGLACSYGILAWMLAALPPRDALTTWLVFAAAGGAVVMGYELWARRRYRGTGRPARPLVALQGIVLWPILLPDAVEGMFVDAGILPQGRAHGGRDTSEIMRAAHAAHAARLARLDAAPPA